MKIKTSELTDAALDWAVAKCEGIEVEFHMRVMWMMLYNAVRGRECPVGDGGVIYSPRQDWSQGGPIIERENIFFDGLPDNGHRAFQRDKTGLQINFMDCWFSTKLETAMRCYVASNLGDEVDVPEELCA